MPQELVCNAFEKPFPHLIVDNFYDDGELELIWEELKFYTKPGKLLEPKDFGGVIVENKSPCFTIRYDL